MNSNLDLLRVCETLEFNNSTAEDRGNLSQLRRIDLLSFINIEKTKKLQSEEKYIKFRQWLEDNNVIYPGVEYPVAFGRNGELIGMAAKKDIPPQKAFLFVPQRLMINEITVKNSPIGFIVDKHSDIFKYHYDAESANALVNLRN